MDAFADILDYFSTSNTENDNPESIPVNEETGGSSNGKDSYCVVA
jgi:hypothetical protein